MGSTGSMDARALRDEAAAALEHDRPRRALACYRELEALEPDEASWSRRMADLHRKLGDHDEAVAAYERAAERYAAAGFLVQAIAVCKVMLQLAPERSGTLRRLAAMNDQAPGARPRATRADAPTISRPPPVPPAGGGVAGARVPRPAPAAVALQRDAPLDQVSLRDVMPGAQPLRSRAGGSSGMIVIPLDDDELLEVESVESEGAPLIVEIAPEREGSARLEAPPLDDDPRGVTVVELSLEPGDAVEDDEPGHRPIGPAARRALVTTPLLSALPAAVLERLLERIDLVELPAGQVLFREGEAGTTLYVVSEGEVVVVGEGPPRVELSRLGPGQFFGEIALVTEQPRSATIEAGAATEVLAIGRDVVNGLIAEFPAVLRVILRFLRDRLVDRLIRTSPLFRPFADPERRALAARFHFIEVQPDTPLVTQGEHSDGLVVILAGAAEVVRIVDGVAAAVGRLGPGDLCGEMSLLSGDEAIATVRTEGKVLALHLPARDFRELIMTHPQVLAFVGELADERRRQLDRTRGARPPTGDPVDLRLGLL